MSAAIRWGVTTIALGIAATPAGAAKPCALSLATTTDSAVSACHRELGSALTKTVCAGEELFEVKDNKLRVKHLLQRNEFRKQIMENGARGDCPEPARHLAQELMELKQQRKSSSDKEDVQKLIAELFVVGQTDTGFEISPRPGHVGQVTTDARQDTGDAARGADATATGAGGVVRGAGTTEPEAGTTTKLVAGNAEQGKGAATEPDRPPDVTRWLAVALLSAFLGAAVVAAMLFFLLRTIRGAAAMLDKRGGNIERSITAMESSYRKTSEDVTGLFIDAITEMNGRLQRIEYALEGIERALTQLSSPLAPVITESQPRQVDTGGATRAFMPPVSSAPARLPSTDTPQKPELDIDAVSEDFNRVSSGQQRERDFREYWRFDDVFMDELGKLHRDQRDGTLSMWIASSGKRNEFILLPAVRQVVNDLQKLMGNGIEAARRKLGMAFEVAHTERGGRYAVLERPAVVAEIEGTTIVRQKGLLRLPFGS